MSGTKRAIEACDEFEDLGAVHMSKKARVHGVLTSLSPMKNSAAGTTKYYDGQLTNGKKNLRLVGFDAKVHQRLRAFLESKAPVAISNCEIKESKYSSELELVVRNSSDPQTSPVKFDAQLSKLAQDKDGGKITLSELPMLSNFQKVSIRVKVIFVNDPEEVKRGLTKQECVIGDATGRCKVILWEDNVDLLVEGASYKMSGLMVRVYRGKKYLSIPRENFEVVSIDDIGCVEECESEDEEKREMKGGVVVGVKFFDVYSGCYACKGKVQPMSDVLAECTRCGMTQRLSRCNELASAKVDIETQGVIKSLSVFSPRIEEICQGEGSKLALLSSEPFDLTYSENNIILSVSR